MNYYHNQFMFFMSNLQAVGSSTLRTATAGASCVRVTNLDSYFSQKLAILSPKSAFNMPDGMNGVSLVQ